MSEKVNKVLVTGAGGYIGSIATYLLLNKGYQVVGIENFSTGYKQPLEFFKEKFSDRFIYYQADLKDKKSISEIFAQENNIDAVIHYAAHCLVSESVDDPGKYFENNVFGTLNLVSEMLAADVNNLVFSSTCEVYGDADYVPVDEKHAIHPNTPYGASKRMAEEIIEWHDRLKGLNYVIHRYFNVCGASDDGVIGDSKRPSVLLMQNAVRGALGIEQFYLTYRDVDTKDGSPIRDYINVVDLNEAHILSLEHLVSGGSSQIINLGTGEGNSVLEIVEKVQEVTGVKFEAQRGEARKGEANKIFADVTKAKEVLGWEPKRSIEDSVNSLVKWYKDHPNGWSR